MNINLREGRNITSQEKEGETFYFKKIMKGPKDDAKRRFNNLIKWDHLSINFPQIYSPRLVKTNEDDLSLLYEWIDETASIEEHLQKNSSELESLIIKASQILAKLHILDNSELELDDESEVLNRERVLFALDKYEYASCTGAELELYNLLQQDKQLIETTLKQENTTDQYLCHGDIRLDQFIYDGKDLRIIDFEELRIGDPSKDLSGIIGSLYFNCLLKTFSETTQETSNEREVEQQFINRGTAYIDEILPIIRSSFNAYKQVKEINKTQLSINIGWFIIERIMSRAKFTFRLSATDKAILGIGREIIINPHNFEDIF
ncbi:aminoglycoside phosphotransferase family protein [Staphylococcus equorum]|uniref:Aminoglycoside phosphotransferase family protein n=1 Tax=Staphylococcus equorum TaxID=246432 RepID=A0A9X4LGE3_9STAP|nr:phosphotransferase [Staphylococcus equorum]MDG0843984.1 aminoglycoside phosphotransferase family protein [Staphylococcus equorum]MDG0860275.1 aminoglycoside phosphotransferase family protein [Staphylococcus equorum]